MWPRSSTGKDTTLRRLQRQLAELTNLLSLEKGQGKKTRGRAAGLQSMVATLKSDNERLTGQVGLGGEKDAHIATLSKELADKSMLTSEAQAKVDLLNQQPCELRRQMAAIQEALERGRVQGQGQPGADRRPRQPPRHAARQAGAGAAALPLGLLRPPARLLRDRKDIRVVGDRFVFELEVLFASGQAALTVEGLASIDQLATAIVELEKSIPPEIDWTLQVEGHTDVRKISSAQFPSNCSSPAPAPDHRGKY